MFWVSLVLGNESIEWKIEIKTECNEILKIEERIKNVKEGTLRWLGLTKKDKEEKEEEKEVEEDVLEIEIGQHVESWVEKKKNENATVGLCFGFGFLDFVSWFLFSRFLFLFLSFSLSLSLSLIYTTNRQQNFMKQKTFLF